MRRVLWVLLLCGAAVTLSAANASSPENLFRSGLEAYRTGEFARAAEAFRESAALSPASGTFQNLGNAEWESGNTGEAILAWERALWINPFDARAENNLRFARRTAQLEPPRLTWYEIASTWLPANWWAWLATLSLWLVVGLMTLPTVFRLRRAPWHQAVAALGFGIFLLTLPAHAGMTTRARIGFMLEKDVLLRLTPTAEAEGVTRLAEGDAARYVRAQGNYLFVKTTRGSGWVLKEQMGMINF